MTCLSTEKNILCAFANLTIAVAYRSCNLGKVCNSTHRANLPTPLCVQSEQDTAGPMLDKVNILLYITNVFDNYVYSKYTV